MKGMALVFRRPKSDKISQTICFKALDDETLYEICYENNGAVYTRYGKELKTGVDIRILDKPGSELITYKAVK